MKKALLYFILCFAAFNPMQLYGQTYIFTFDPGDTLWPEHFYVDTVNYHHNIWQVGQPHKTVLDSAYSYPNAIVTDTLNPYPPNDTSSFIFTFSSSSLGSDIYSVNYYHKTDSDSSSITLIQFSNDSGRTWGIVSLDGPPLPSEMYAFSSGPNPSGKNDWNNDVLYFWTSTYHAHPNPTMKLRFTFISGSSASGKGGWIIDNFCVNYQSLSVPTIQNDNRITLFPNPATTSLEISASDGITSVAITNLIGQTVYTQNYNSPQVQIDVAYLPTGIYFVKVNNTEVRRFVKE